MYVKEIFMTYAKCLNWDKPGKNEIPKSLIDWQRVKNFPDCDRKRSTVCRPPACNQAKSVA
jgi:hypothetical protein